MVWFSCNFLSLQQTSCFYFATSCLLSKTKVPKSATDLAVIARLEVRSRARVMESQKGKNIVPSIIELLKHLNYLMCSIRLFYTL